MRMQAATASERHFFSLALPGAQRGPLVLGGEHRAGPGGGGPHPAGGLCLLALDARLRADPALHPAAARPGSWRDRPALENAVPPGCPGDLQLQRAALHRGPHHHRHQRRPDPVHHAGRDRAVEPDTLSGKSRAAADGRRDDVHSGRLPDRAAGRSEDASDHVFRAGRPAHGHRRGVLWSLLRLVAPAPGHPSP